MAHTAWCQSATGKAIVDKLKSNIAKTFAGSGDPEVYDCPHVIELIQSKFADDFQFKAQLDTLYQQLRQRMPTWTPPVVQATVPAIPNAHQVADGWLMIWQFGKTDDAGIKGRSNMVNILELSFSFLENTFNSAQHPLDILFAQQSGQPIGDFSVRLSVGFTRVLAAYVCLIAMMDLDPAELAEVLPVLCSLFIVRYTYNPAPSDALQRKRSLAAKFQVSESTRPDPLQMFHMFAEGLMREGSDVATGLAGKIQEYNQMSSIASQNISDLEASVICALPSQTQVFRDLLKYHWQNYKNAESGVPMKLFAFIDAEVPVEATGTWKNILAPSPEKNELFIRFLIGTFVKNFKDAIRMKKKPNLRFGAGKLRVSDPLLAYRQCCVWVHFRDRMRSEMSAPEFENIEKMFCRGAFDRELSDRVRAMNPTLKFEDLRFFYVHMGREQPLKEDCQLNASQEEAEALQEQACCSGKCFFQNLPVSLFLFHFFGC